MNRHVLVKREETTQERRHSTDVVCIDGRTGCFDVRHARGRILPLKLAANSGEKLFILEVRLLYCTNDMDREWRFELHDLWDSQLKTSPIQVLVPPAGQTRGPVPEKDQCIYKPSIVARWPAFLGWVGMEHSLQKAHSSCVRIVDAKDKAKDGQLFEESDPFLQFTREHWSLFEGLADYDVVLVSGVKEPPIYRISSHAIARITHTMKTLFEEVRYKTGSPWLELRVDPGSLIGNTATATAEPEGDGFSGCVMLFQVAYLVVSPTVPKCRVVEQPLVMHV